MAYVGEEATIVLSGIGTELSDGMLMNMYRTYGPIVRVRHNGTNSAQVVFAQKQHAERAVEATNGAVVYGKTLKVSLQRKFKKTTEPCRGFAAGICRKGDMCKYYHVTDNAAFASPVPVVAKASREAKKKTPKPKTPKPVSTEPAAVPSDVQGVPSTQLCRHFTRGFCAQGSACTFAHVLGVAKDAVPASTGKVAQLCQFFLNGVCTRGDACRFIHQAKTVSRPEKTSTTQTSVQSEQESESEVEAEAEAESEQSEDTRICVECEKPDVAVWKCSKCDNSLYCDDCNSAVHRARVMAKHKRTKLPPIPTLPRCGECEASTASVRCEQCEVPFCVSCDASVHKFKSLRKHTRVKLAGKVEKAKATKKAKEEPKATKAKETKKKEKAVESASRPKVVDPVPYVESVPQLEFSSESSESEDEEMQPPTTQSTDNDEPMADASETESEEDFDDVKPQASAPVAPTPAVKEQASNSSDSEAEENFDDKPADKPTPSPASVPKMELSSDSDSSDDEASEPTPAPTPTAKADVSSESGDESEDEALSKPAVQSTPAPTRTPTLAELSSESDSDSDDEALAKKLTVKQAKKPEPKTPTKSPVAKTKPAASSSSSSSSSSDSSDSEDEAPAKPAKPTPAPRARNHKAGGISEGSSHTLVKKIEGFGNSGEGNELHLDANLNGFERLLAHDCAERLGLAHESIGSGLERHIIISRHGAKRPAASSGQSHKTKKSKHRH
ncbi:R3H domain [Phytophthora infestans]|uniref:R3H domain n=1 Tax=Phytophthora infestans TaxID=4787 RepID=A0A833SW19_PHYIN|nr:R3H domain [Phytophthora infestans]KAF4143896.1 R3H domain [Phytophthora infestans]